MWASAVLIVALCSTAAMAGERSGVPRVIDGDTVELAGVKIRLEGIDAPESDQLCLDAKGEHWPCGIAARDALYRRAKGKLWTCRIQGVDRYNRSLATCEMLGENVNKWMVRSGWALSFTRYSRAYDEDESVARSAHSGLWGGAFIAPWDWRARNEKTIVLGALSVPTASQKLLLGAVSSARAPDPNCTIKGNLNRRGECLYHVPGGRFYSRLRMDRPDKRWFCTEEEAQAAGCRRSKL